MEKTVSSFVVFCDFCRLPNFFIIRDPNPIVLQQKNKVMISLVISIIPDWHEKNSFQMSMQPEAELDARTLWIIISCVQQAAFLCFSNSS